MHSHLLERSGPADVGRFVAPRLEFDERRHLLATFGRAYQGRHHRAVSRGPVKGLFYSQDMGVRGCLLDEGLGRHGEALVRVVHENVFAGNGGENVNRFVVERGQAHRGHRGERFVLQLGTVEAVDRPQTAVVQQAVQLVDVFGPQIKLPSQKIPDVGVEGGLDLEADGPPEPPSAQLHLDRLQKVVRLFLGQGEVGVADHPERVAALYFHPREQFAEECSNDLFDGHKSLTVG